MDFFPPTTGHMNFPSRLPVEKNLHTLRTFLMCSWINFVPSQRLTGSVIRNLRLHSRLRFSHPVPSHGRVAGYAYCVSEVLKVSDPLMEPGFRPELKIYHWEKVKTKMFEFELKTASLTLLSFQICKFVLQGKMRLQVFPSL